MSRYAQWHNDSVFVDPHLHKPGRNYDTESNTVTTTALSGTKSPDSPYAQAFRGLLAAHEEQALSNPDINWAIAADHKVHVCCDLSLQFPLRKVTFRPASSTEDTLYMYLGPVTFLLDRADGPRICRLTYGLSATTLDEEEYTIICPLCWSGTQKDMHNRSVIAFKKGRFYRIGVDWIQATRKLTLNERKQRLQEVGNKLVRSLYAPLLLGGECVKQKAISCLVLFGSHIFNSVSQMGLLLSSVPCGSI